MILYNFRRKFLTQKTKIVIAYSKKPEYTVWAGIASNIPGYYLNEKVVIIEDYMLNNNPHIYIALKECYK